MGTGQFQPLWASWVVLLLCWLCHPRNGAGQQGSAHVPRPDDGTLLRDCTAINQLHGSASYTTVTPQLRHSV